MKGNKQVPFRAITRKERERTRERRRAEKRRGEG